MCQTQYPDAQNKKNDPMGRLFILVAAEGLCIPTHFVCGPLSKSQRFRCVALAKPAFLSDPGVLIRHNYTKIKTGTNPV